MVKEAQTQTAGGNARTSRARRPVLSIATAFGLALLLPAGTAFSQAKIPDLEQRVWTSDLRDFAELESKAVRQIQLNPRGAYEHYVTAELFLRMYKQNPSDLRYLKTASELSQQAIELDPNKEYGYLVAAQVLDLMGYRDDAADLLRPKPSFHQGWRSAFVKGVVASAQSAEQASLGEYEKALTMADVPREMVASFVATSLESLHGGEELVDQLASWRKKADAPALKLSHARALQEAGRAAEAHSLYAQLEPEKNSEIALADGVLLYSKLNKSREAEERLNIALNDKHNPEVVTAAKAHLGRIALSAKDTRKASALFREVMQGTENRIQWLSFIHKAYSEKKDLNAFATFLDEMQPTIEGTGYFYALKGEVQSESLAQHEKAVKSFRSAITLDPQRSEFYNGLGLAFYRMNEHEKALGVFHQALAIDPKDATARYNEACVLALMGRGDEAIGSLKKAISLDGRLQSVALQDKDFASLRSLQDFQSLVENQASAQNGGLTH